MEATSREAYEIKKPTIKNDYDLILAVLSDEKEQTYNEISKSVRLKLYNEKKTIQAQNWINPNKVSRRMKELITLKKVKYGETRKCTVANSNCKTYLLNN